MEELIPLINKLQSVFKSTGMEEIKLPQIVVIGPQSSGKSSVLESLVKKPFLPRGTGIVTRCPIILQLHQTKENLNCTSENVLNDRISKKKQNVEIDGKGATTVDVKETIQHPKEWCCFEKIPDQKFSDFDKVRRQIEKFQVELAGDKKGISMEPIILEVHSPNVIDLTVVDLPGIVHLAMEGQANDIETQVLEMINTYISNPSAIILAVSPATADIATSESIKIAKQVDPNGERTIGVLTKLDAMEDGTDATDVLTGKTYPVKLGIIGVINRSQHDINNNMSVEDVIKKEESFLEKKYPHIHGIGSAYLAGRLNIILKEHIDKNLPELIKRIADCTQSCTEELKSLGPEISKDPADCQWLIIGTTMKFLSKFEEMVKYRPKVAPKNGAKTFAVAVNDVFAKLRSDITVRPVEYKMLQISLKNTQNVEGFSSIEEVFKNVVKEKVGVMEATALEAAQSIHDVIAERSSSCLDDKRLGKLNNIIRRVVDDLLADQLKQLKFAIGEYIKMQMNLIFSSDPEFLKILARGTDPEPETDSRGQSIIRAPVNTINAFPMSTEFRQHDSKTLYVQNLITQYLLVIKRELSDYIPKLAMYYLAYQTQEKLDGAVKQATIGKEAALVAEPEAISIRRKLKQELLMKFQEAAKIVRDIRTSG